MRPIIPAKSTITDKNTGRVGTVEGKYRFPDSHMYLVEFEDGEQEWLIDSRCVISKEGPDKKAVPVDVTPNANDQKGRVRPSKRPI